MSFKHTLATPEVESKTTDTVRIKDYHIAGLHDGRGPVATVSVEKGYQDGENFVLHQTTSYHIPKATLQAELDKATTDGDTQGEAIERAIFAALAATGQLSSGTLS